MSTDLFGEEIPMQPAPGSKLGPKGGKHYVKPWGYFAPPGTGPVGETCKTCAHIVVRGNVAGRYLKCLRAKGKWTGGRKSDILAGSPACSGWESPKQHSDNHGVQAHCGAWSNAEAQQVGAPSPDDSSGDPK